MRSCAWSRRARSLGESLCPTSAELAPVTCDRMRASRPRRAYQANAENRRASHPLAAEPHIRR
eukprot:47747-Chlamydomonas_euryale.AAC.6